MFVEVGLKPLWSSTVKTALSRKQLTLMYYNLQILTSAQPILVMSMRRALTQTAPSSVLVVLVLMEMARFAKVRSRSLVNELEIFIFQTLSSRL